MGNRCYVEITLAKRDLQEFADIQKLIHPDWEPVTFVSPGCIAEPGDWFDDFWQVEGNVALITLMCAEANYAYSDELEHFARAELLFEGHNDPGEDYGAALFASNGSKACCWCDAASSGFPVAPIVNGKAVMTAYNRYYEAVQNVVKYFEQC